MLGWLAANWVEVAGFVTGAACVALAVRRSVWTFPVGIANTLLYLGLFWDAALYAESGLQLVYLALNAYGWLAWATRRDRDAARVDEGFVRRTPRAAVLPLVVGGVAATAVIAWLLRSFTDSTTVIADAATTGFSLVAQVMLNLRWLESWLVWIAVDVALVALFASKGLVITAVLYAGFVVLAAAGYRSWRRAARPRDRVAAEAAHA